MKRWSPWRYDADQDDAAPRRQNPFVYAAVKIRHVGEPDRITAGNLLTLGAALAGLTFAWWLWQQ